MWAARVEKQNHSAHSLASDQNVQCVEFGVASVDGV